MTQVSDRLIEIVRRKERLIARAEAQRGAIAVAFQQLRRPVGILDRGLEVARYLRAHPVLVAALVAALVVFRRRRLISLAGTALTAWRLWRSVSRWTTRLT